MFGAEILMALVVLLVCMGWYPCCCTVAPTDCIACIDNAAPASYSVTIPALAANTCLNCSGYAGTYVVSYSHTDSSGFCFYDLETSNAGSCGSGDMTVRLQLAQGLLVYPIYVTIQTGASYLWIWKLNPDTSVDIDCFFDEQDFSSNGNLLDYICDGTGTNVTVSAVT